MKITRRQLKRILEVSLGISDSEIAAAKKKLKDEGGAAAADQVADAVRQAETGDGDKDMSSQVKLLLMLSWKKILMWSRTQMVTS